MVQRSAFPWSAVILSCQHKDSVHVLQRELELRQQRGVLPASALLLTVPDRETAVGSGGATINALLVAAEHLSSRANHSVVTADVLDDAHILILHTGRDFPWSSCSRTFCVLPQEEPDQKVQAPVCILDLLLDCLSNQLCPGSPPGVWVCSTDVILRVPTDFRVCWQGFSGVAVVSFPAEVSFAAHHGVYLSDSQGGVKNIIYRGNEEQIKHTLMPDGHAPLVSGPVFFSRSVSEKLLQCHVSPPLDGCTYLGLDCGAPPLKISLFLDVLKCFCSDVSFQSFVSEEREGDSAPSGPQGAALRCGRAELWRILGGEKMSLVYVPNGRYDYLTSSGREHVQRLTQDWTNKNTLSHIQVEGMVSGGARIINSVLEGDVAIATGAVVQHCHLQGPLNIPSGCFLSGFTSSESLRLRSLQLQTDLMLQSHRMKLGDMKMSVYSVMGAKDDLEASCEHTTATFINHSWEQFFSRTGIKSEELWAPGESHSLLDARLFPVLHPREGAVGVEDGVGWLLGAVGEVGALGRWREAWRLSLREVLSLTLQGAELQWREELHFLSGRRRISNFLLNRSNVCLLPLLRAAVQGGQQGALLDTLDQIAVESVDVAPRCLACVSDVLALTAAGKGGLRSGPAANQAWSSAYILLDKGDLRGGVSALANQRQRWLNRPELLLRAARHYEGAGQVLLRREVMSSQRFICIGQAVAPPPGQWQEVECPARLDLAGGWSDTPPITFEHGGSVTNMAVKVDGRRPIGARARRISEPRLLLVNLSGGRNGEVSMEIVCESLDDMKDFNQPHAPGALLKAVCVCSGLLSLDSKNALSDQLIQRWGGGLEIHSWSELPTGSGLGTSSILAGALLAAVYRCTGRSFSVDSLIHQILILEQIMTTGGGWQDQVGGLLGGVKVARCEARLPLKVEVEQLNISEDFRKTVEQHLLLVYTGKTRLARNLLQDVVRSWHSRLPEMVGVVDQLVLLSEEAAQACSEGSLLQLASCLERTWQQKKLMASGCEPMAVRALMDALKPTVLGQSLAGAGGGGFLYLLTNEPRQEGTVLQILRNNTALRDVSVHTVQLDMDGIIFLPPKDAATADQ
ncbi:L-fucose kinase [Gouania willdenowi]|uniref:L-fucose kinase n=1 Tax=Gouania willdenowi TaxID=441366 RepID=UPI0010551DEB|nr:L-fucose kinase [Gouania willdenowi]